MCLLEYPERATCDRGCAAERDGSSWRQWCLGRLLPLRSNFSFYGALNVYYLRRRHRKGPQTGDLPPFFSPLRKFCRYRTTNPDTLHRDSLAEEKVVRVGRKRCNTDCTIRRPLRIENSRHGCCPFPVVIIALLDTDDETGRASPSPLLAASF